MANMLYNGVELPDINAVWTDKETYPYALISDVTSLGSGYLFAAFRDIPSVNQDGGVFSQGDDGTYLSCQALLDSEEFEWGTTESYSGAGISAILGTVIWTSSDILNEDGSIYLAASDPVNPHITESSGDGYALYNGVKLPNIDSVWTDKETYPYAVIDEFDYSSDIGVEGAIAYTLTLSSGLPTRTDGYPYYKDVDICLYRLTFCPELAEIGEEVGMIFGVNEWKQGEDDSYSPGSPLYVEPFWTSFDILKTDNTVYLAASDPIPLDGMTVIEWDGVTDGLEGQSILWRVADFVPKPKSAYCVATYLGNVEGVYSTITDIPEPAGSWICGKSDVDTSVSCISGDYQGVSAGLYFIGASTAYTTLFAYIPASSEPEEPEDTTKKDFWNGVACGLCGSGTPNFSDTSPFGVGYITGCKLRALRERKPIAYLYNGVRLPPLPEWDKTAYPYAVIQYTTIIPESPKYRLLCSASPTVLSTGIFGGSTPAPCLIWTARDTWVGGYINEDGQTWVNCTLIWANYDVYYSGGETLAMAVSEPVPVYE